MTEPERSPEGSVRDASPASSDLGLDNPVIAATRPLAGLAILALLTGRAIAPALRGVVGGGWFLQTAELVGALSSQVFAFAAMMAAVLAVMAVSRSHLPMAVRLAALTLGAFAVLPTVWALHEPVPELSRSLVAASACILALTAVPVVLRAPFARGPGVVVGLIALGGALRIAAIGVAIARHGATAAMLPVFDVLGTAALLCEAGAIAVAFLWVASRSKQLTSPAAVAALVVAAILTRQALAGQNVEAGAFDVVCWRGAVRLLSTPDAALPLGLRLFVSVLAPLAGLVALFARNIFGPLGAVIALALAARGATEMPPCALMLVVASLALALTAIDRKASWAAIVAGARPPP